VADKTSTSPGGDRTRAQPGRRKPVGKDRDRRARLEDLKRQQRAAERRKTILTIVSGLIVGAILIAIPVVTTVLQSAEKKHKAAVGYVTTPTAAAKAADCTGVRNDKASPGGQHTPDRVTYDTAPPSSGRHNNDPLPDSIHFYARPEHPSIERAVHLLEHGFVVGWYDAKLPADQVAKLKASGTAGERFVAVPWDRQDFGENRHFALTAWGRTELCATVSPKAISEFVAKYVDKTAPEPGAAGGSLPGASAPATPPTPPTSPAPSASPTTK
jgi:hypothetical protein